MILNYQQFLHESMRYPQPGPPFNIHKKSVQNIVQIGGENIRILELKDVNDKGDVMGFKGEMSDGSLVMVYYDDGRDAYVIGSPGPDSDILNPNEIK